MRPRSRLCSSSMAIGLPNSWPLAERSFNSSMPPTASRWDDGLVLPRPLMVHAQHSWEVAAAQGLVEDFPKALFIHIRYPLIRGFDSWFDRVTHIETDDGEYPNRNYLKPALTVFEDMLAHDRPHPGMGERTRAVRFNDLHLANAETLRLVTEWLGLPYRPSLRESTFNGLPFVAESNGTDWVGARPEQFGRPAKNLNRLGRIFLYALLHENFVAWGFQHPQIFRYAWARRIVVTVLRQVPTKMEFRASRLIMSLQVRPALRRGEFGFAMRALARLIACRIELARIVGREFHRRIDGRWGRMEWSGDRVPGHFQVLGQNVPKAVERLFPIFPQPDPNRPSNPGGNDCARGDRKILRPGCGFRTDLARRGHRCRRHRQGGGLAGADRSTYSRSRFRGRENPCHRQAGPHARSKDASLDARPGVDLCLRRPAVLWLDGARRRVLLQSGSRYSAARRTSAFIFRFLTDR